jgi:hypothetical protein
MASNKNETIAKLLSVVMLLSFVFFVYKHNNSVNEIIDNKSLEKSDKIESKVENERNDEKEKMALDISKLFPVTATAATANVPKETTQQQANNIQYKGELTPGFSKKSEKEQAQIIAETYYQKWKNLHKNNPKAYDLHDQQVLENQQLYILF